MLACMYVFTCMCLHVFGIYMHIYFSVHACMHVCAYVCEYPKLMSMSSLVVHHCSFDAGSLAVTIVQFN